MATEPISGTPNAACPQEFADRGVGDNGVGDYGVGDKDIGDELEHVLASAPFRSAPRLAAFLRFVVEMTLAGQSNRIKGYTIGAHALGRGESFDPQTDPIVRVEAARLRRALARYYGGAGSNDPVVIELPRGGYVPTFHTRTAGAASAAPCSDYAAAMRSMPNGSALAAVLDGLIEVRQQQMETITAEVETARRMLDLMRELLVTVGGDACRTALLAPNATSAAAPARVPRPSETPPHSQYRRYPDRRP